MRLSPVAALAIALAAALQPFAAAAPTRIEVTLQLEEPTLAPGSHTEVAGRVALTFPTDESCAEDMDVRFVLLQGPENASVTLEPLNWTVPAPSVAANARVEHDIHVTYDVASNASAYDFLIAQVGTIVPACGNVQSAIHTVQLAPRVTFLPSLEVEALDEDEGRWTLGLTNVGNGALDVDWQLRQPSRGRVLVAGETRLANPLEDAEGARVEVEVSKAGVDHHAPIIFNATLAYAGNHTPIEPPMGFFQTELGSTVNPSSRGLVWAGIIGGVLLAAVIVGGALWTRRRP